MDFSKYGSDKETEHHYFTDVYNDLFDHLREAAGYDDESASILELGLWGGGCLKMWSDFFGMDAKITGVDINPIRPDIADGEIIRYYQGNQIDEALMGRIGDERGPFDVIIDDASHSGHESFASVMLLWPWLKPGGIYVIEDIFYAWPEFHDRDHDGDGKMIECVVGILKHLPLFQIQKFHIDYRVQSGVLWMLKNPDGQ